MDEFPANMFSITSIVPYNTLDMMKPW